MTVIEKITRSSLFNFVIFFLADVDDSYRMTVIEKIKGLMDEVEVIHKKEEAQLQKRLVSLTLICNFLKV
jgi:hypothetical protein